MSELLDLLRPHIPSFNPKHVSSTYLKTESQSLWSRNAIKRGKAPVVEDPPSDQRYVVLTPLRLSS
jgi:hypothetical protein